MNLLFRSLFYVAYISMVVLFCSLSPSQLTSNAKKSFNIFGLSVLFVIVSDIVGFVFGFKYTFIRDFLLFTQVIFMFVILAQLKHTKLSKISISSYFFTQTCLIIYSLHTIYQFITSL